MYLNRPPEVYNIFLKGLIKSIRMAVRVYLINNRFIARKVSLRLSENVAAENAYKRCSSFILNRAYEFEVILN